MRCAHLLSCFFIVSIISAQNWSPSGATWTYGLQGAGITGYSRYTYAGDTLLHDTLGQRIDLEDVIVFEPEPTPVVNTHPNAVITSYSNDVVSVWDQLSEHWDTLFWFDAAVNDFWQPPHYEGECGDAEKITVVAIGTLEEEGETLRWLDLANDRGRIVERAGWFWNLEITPSCLIVEGLAGQRCYSDDEITYSPPTWTVDCSAIGMSERVLEEALFLFPNPGKDHVTIRSAMRPAMITVRDMLGRIVLGELAPEGTVLLNATALATGCYSIQALGDDGRVQVQRWIRH